MVEIVPAISAGDICDASVDVGIYQVRMNKGDETYTYDANYDDALGDGNTADDIQVETDGRIYLRAERGAANPEGRKYIITYKAADSAGNTETALCEVVVPHDQR
jgi:hypothetical protein